MRGLRRAGRLLAVLALQLAAAFLLLELVARAFDPLGISYYPETARYLDTLVREEPIGYRNRPGLRGTYYGVPVAINSHGMRDREVGEKPPGESRVLVLGDSIPFGIGVRYEDSLPYRLELELRRRHPQRPFRTLNMGVPSYNTEQERIQLETLGLRLDPDVVLLFFASNDIEPKLWVLDKRGRWYVDLAQRSYAASALYVMLRGLLAAAAASDGTGTGAPGIRRPGVAMHEFRADSARWQAIDRALSEINALLRARGTPFAVYTLDEPPYVLDLLRAVAAREGFPVVTLRPLADPRWAGLEPSLLHNSRIDSHPSPLGNRALATLVAESFGPLGLLR